MDVSHGGHRLDLVLGDGTDDVLRTRRKLKVEGRQLKELGTPGVEITDKVFHT